MEKANLIFCTVITCMDGRIQLPVNKYLRKRFNSEYVDTISEAGPNLILANNTEDQLINSIFSRLKISVENHNSTGIAIVGHYDCAGNPASYDEQLRHITQSVELIQQKYLHLEVIGLWVNSHWEVEEIKVN